MQRTVIGGADDFGNPAVQGKGRFRKKRGAEIIPDVFKGQIIGGVLFGFGWALTGACPGPMYAQLGSGIAAASIMILSAISGTWIYGFLREKLPH